jgi:hypothetical protein
VVAEVEAKAKDGANVVVKSLRLRIRIESTTKLTINNRIPVQVLAKTKIVRSFGLMDTLKFKISDTLILKIVVLKHLVTDPTTTKCLLKIMLGQNTTIVSLAT